MRSDRAAMLLMVLVCIGCGDDLDGPERFEFDEIDGADVEVDSGELRIFGSGNSAGATVERWWNGDEHFRQLSESNSGRELLVEALCADAADCRARYDIAIPRSASVQAHLARGEMTLVRLGGTVEATMGDGELVAANLTASSADVRVDKGSARVGFRQPPDHVQVELGEEASALILVPEQGYRCNFDVDAQQVSIGELECDPGQSNTIELSPPDADVQIEVR